MALAVDGFVSGSAASASSKALPGLTTANANCVIVLVIMSWGNAALAFATPTDSAGLTWTKRGSTRTNSSERIEEWYAVSSGTLSSDVITVSTSGGTSVTQITGAAWAVSGANTATPFDSNASLPAFGAAANVTVSTANANDFLVAFQTYTNTNGSPSSANTTWTQDVNNVAFTIGYSAYHSIISSTLSSETITRGVTGSLSDILLDAVQAAGGGGGTIILPPYLFDTRAI